MADATNLLRTQKLRPFGLPFNRALGDIGLPRKIDTGRDPSGKELIEADRIAQLHPSQQKNHPSAISADHEKLGHINTYGDLPEFYIDRPFVCRICGRREIWRAKDQQWYYEEKKHHIDSLAAECHSCRNEKKQGGKPNVPAT